MALRLRCTRQVERIDGDFDLDFFRCKAAMFFKCPSDHHSIFCLVQHQVYFVHCYVCV